MNSINSLTVNRVHNDYVAFLDRVRSQLSQTKDLRILARWIVENTRHPKYPGQNFSYLDHEFQEKIASDPSPESSTCKCAQIGLSELQARIALAFSYVFAPATSIYTLPTRAFAQKFTKTRFDTIIRHSPLLKSSKNVDNDSTELKQIGDSFLYINGTIGKSAAISVPADALFHDEVDFSNQDVLTQYMSRLGHAENGGIRRYFSTPTVSGYGISERVKNSEQVYRYGIKCHRCAEWVFPIFKEDVVLPGFDEEIVKLEKVDVEKGALDLKKAYLRCPSCHSPITQDNLCDVSARKWIGVAREHRPSAEYHSTGYYVQPFDVPKVNPIEKTLRSIGSYKRTSDWVNFALGDTFQDAETSFLTQDYKALSSMRVDGPLSTRMEGTVLGMDVGKTSHLVVGKRLGPHRLDLIYAATFKNDGSEDFLQKIMSQARLFGVAKGVIDAGPDFSTSLGLIKRGRYMQFFACYYVRKARALLSEMDVEEEEQVVKVSRTHTLDRAAKLFNTGKLNIMQMEELPTILNHLGNLKRVKEPEAEEETAQWVKVGPDHYGHAINYMLIADSLMEYNFSNVVVPGISDIHKVKLKERPSHANQA